MVDLPQNVIMYFLAATLVGWIGGDFGYSLYGRSLELNFGLLVTLIHIELI